MIATLGLGSQQLVVQGYGDFGTHSDLSVDVTPAQVWPFTEAKPSDGYTLEALPTRPPGQDGAYTDPSQDGAWDEYPVDGAYTKIGYEPEMKPFHRYSITQEGKPS